MKIWNKYPGAALAAMAAGALALTPRLSWACAMCGLSPGDTGAHAFNTSVLFMMAVPYTVFGGAAIGLWLAYRNARRRRSAKGSSGAIS